MSFSIRRFVALFSKPVVARRVLAVFLLLAFLAALGLAVNDSAETTALRRGDFPAFWSMAVIADGPEPERLYDTALQQQVQNAAWPSLAGAILPAVYPAHVALLVRPLAWCDHRVARWIWTVLSVLAALVGVSILVRSNPQISWAPWMVFAVLCIFGPFVRGVMGGQVLSFMVLFYALGLVCARSVLSYAGIVLGVVLGVWLCKPYYALCALLVPVLQRRKASLVSFALVALIMWQLGALVVGYDWVAQWSGSIRRFAQVNLETNAHQMPNLWAQVYRLFGGLGEQGGVLWWITLASAYGALVVGVARIVGIAALRELVSKPTSNGDLLLHLIVSLTVVAMPQVNFYDLGLVACAVVALFDTRLMVDRIFVAVCLMVSQTSVSAPFGVPVHFLLGLAGLTFVCMRVRRVALRRAIS